LILSFKKTIVSSSDWMKLHVETKEKRHE